MKLKLSVHKSCKNKANPQKVARGWSNIFEDITWFSGSDIKKAVSKWPVEICYAVKANPNLGILELLGRLGSGFDVVSGGELLRVLKEFYTTYLYTL